MTTPNRIVSDQGNNAYGTAQGIRNIQGSGSVLGAANFGPIANIGFLEAIAFTSKATGNWNSTGKTTWNQQGLPDPNDNATIQNTHVVTQVQNETIRGLTINGGGEVDITTFNNLNTGITTVTGTLTIGVSADTGLTCIALTVNAGAFLDMQKLSLIYCGGTVDIENSDHWTTSFTGSIILTGSGNYANGSSANYWENFTQNVGVTTTITADDSRFSNVSSNDTVLNGTTVIPTGLAVFIGSDNSGSLTLGASSNFSGDGELSIRYAGASTFVDNNTTAYDFTGLVKIRSQNGSTRIAITGRWDNATYELGTDSPGTVGFVLAAGILGCMDLRVASGSGNTNNIDCATNNPSFEIGGDIDLISNTVAVAWTKGTGTIKLTGNAQSIDLSGQDVETIFSDTDIGDVTILAADTWDIGTLNLITGALTLNGIITIGISADTGLTCAGLIAAAGSTINMITPGGASKIVNSGDLNIDNSTIFNDDYIGNYTQTGDGDVQSLNNDNFFSTYILNEGVTITLVDDFLCTGKNTVNTTINGIVDAAAEEFHIGAANSGSLTLGANCDVLGTNEFRFQMKETTTYTNNKTSAFSFTGWVEVRRQEPGALSPAADFSNANYRLVCNTSFATNFIFTPGTLKCIGFIASNNNTGALTVLNTTNNPSLEFSGDIDLNTGGGSFTTTWTKGTGSITLPGGNANIDFNGQTIEDLIVSGTTKTLTADFTCDSLDVTGILDINDIATVVVTGDLDGAGTITSTNPTNLTVSGSNNFTGTLTNVTII